MEAGILSVGASNNLGDETVMHGTYRYWRELIERGRSRPSEAA